MSLSFMHQCFIVNTALAGMWIIGGRRQFTRRPWPSFYGIASSIIAGWALCFLGAALIGGPLDMRTALWAVTAAFVAIFPVASIVGTPRGTIRALGLWPLVIAAMGHDENRNADYDYGGGEGGVAADGKDADFNKDNNEEEDEARPLTVPAGFALLGGWMGAILLPLDHGTVWQEWPRASIVGTIVGALVGFAILAIFMNFLFFPFFKGGNSREKRFV